MDAADQWTVLLTSGGAQGSPAQGEEETTWEGDPATVQEPQGRSEPGSYPYTDSQFFWGTLLGAGLALLLWLLFGRPQKRAASSAGDMPGPRTASRPWVVPQVCSGCGSLHTPPFCRSARR